MRNKKITNGPHAYGNAHFGWEGSMMAMPAGFGMAASNQISGPVNHCINTNSLLFYWVKPSSIIWKGSGFRVGTGYYHE